MSIVSNLIFHNAKHYVTSPYGYRKSLSTSAGSTGTMHNGTDYGTNAKKIAQYAIEDGVVTSCGTAKDGAKFVWVKYDRLGVKMLHYHLDSISVKTGQKVTKNTVLGKTGKTGKATGIHLHLGIKRLSTGAWVDPEKWAKTEYTSPTAKVSYFKKYTGKSASLVDGLNAVGAKTTFTYRKQIATKNGVKSYVGTAKQNTTLLNLLKKGKLIKP